MKKNRVILLFCIGILLAVWLVFNRAALSTDSDFAVRAVLGTVFSLLVLVRRKRPATDLILPEFAAPALALLGTLFFVVGIIFDVHQFHWLGFLLLIGGCLLWTLPPIYYRDVFLSLFLFYWVYPLPSQIFGPLQLHMQRLSVMGSEWLLHCLNVRVWADEMVLRTGFAAFEVPEACSGMRTAVTVLLCALGAGVMLRFRWYELIVLIVLGLAQVLIFNVLRISSIVVMSTGRPADWGTTFLHDTLGILLLITIVVVQLEALLWNMYRSARMQTSPGKPLPATKTYAFYSPRRIAIRWTVVVVIVLFAAASAAFALYKRRPCHRAMMISTVANRLVQGGPGSYENAEKAAATAARLLPFDYDLQTDFIQTLLLRKKFDAALKDIGKLTPPKDHLVFHTVLKARALMGLNRPGEAMDLIRMLPASAAGHPGVAMVKAEFAALCDDTNAVAENIVLAAKWDRALDKVRALYPYLAARQQWKAIAECYRDVSYKNLTNALIDVDAHLKIDDLQGAEKALEMAVKQWPDDSRLYVCIIELIRMQTDREWKDVLSDKDIVDNIVAAAKWYSTVDQVRSLFPYLAARQQWKTIARCHTDTPYSNITNALIEIHAAMKVNDLAIAGDALKQAMAKWPDDYRLLGYLAVMANSGRGSQWETFFEEKLTRESDKLSADELAVCIENCFQLTRPDLAWLAYNRLQKLDPKHPALYLAPAQFADCWFTFRKHQVGMEAANEDETVYLGSLYFKIRSWPEAPQVRDKGKYAQMCLEECKRREKAGQLTPQMQATYVTALKLSNKYSEAEKRLTQMRKAEVHNRELDNMLQAVDVHVRSNNVAVALESLKTALQKWPDDPTLLGYMTSTIETRSFSTWEDFFEETLRSRLNQLNANALATYIENSFKLMRPDLAWLAYNRLKDLDPSNPALYLALAVYGDAWFVFRKHSVGIETAVQDDPVYLGTLYKKSRAWPEAPLAKELSSLDLADTKSRYLRMCFEELERREKAGRLSLQMQMMYVTTLELAGRYAEAHGRLNAIEKSYPAEKDELLFRHAVIYEKEADWQKVYETIQDYSSRVEQPRLSVTLMQINALMHLDLGVYAMELANRGREVFLDAPQIYHTLASIWTTFGFPEQALFLLEKVEKKNKSLLAAQLLGRTERFMDAETYLSVYGLSRKNLTGRQALLLPPAELSAQGQWGKPLSDAEIEREAGIFAGKARTATSPFIKNLSKLTSEWYGQRGNSGASDPQKWMNAGRNGTEQAIALNELASLLIRQRKFTEARNVVDQALELLPRSALLWRARIALSGCERKTVEEAYVRCPDDPEIWLAYLVVRTREDGSRKWAVAEIRRAVSEERYSVETMVRAGDFLMRNGAFPAASIAAHYATARAEGLLPASVLGLRCALAVQDANWALSCAMKASEDSLEPGLFHKMFSEIKSGSLSANGVTLTFLKQLEGNATQDSRLVKAGSPNVLPGMMENDKAIPLIPMIQTQPASFELRRMLLAAEAAQKAGRLEDAVSILDTAHTIYPSDRIILNNLVYNLALDRKTLPRAVRLLPGLLEAWGEDSIAVMDTAALVYRQSNQPVKAKIYLEKASDLVEKTDPWWLEMNHSIVDIDPYLGKYDWRLDEGLSENEKSEQLLSRASLVPMARDLAAKIKERISKTPGESSHD